MTGHVRTGLTLAAVLVCAAFTDACTRTEAPAPQSSAAAAATPQGGAGAQRPGAVTEQAPGAPAGIEPACQMACSPDKPRTAVASISWSVAQAPASPQALSAGIAQQSLEVTTFKDGFQSGAFARLAPEANQTFGFRAPAAPSSTLAGLTALSVTRVTTLQDRMSGRAAGGDRELMPPAANDDPNRVVVVEIEGLEPGLNYYWRRSPQGPVVRCQAPICPSDARGGR